MLTPRVESEGASVETGVGASVSASVVNEGTVVGVGGWRA